MELGLASWGCRLLAGTLLLSACAENTGASRADARATRLDAATFVDAGSVDAQRAYPDRGPRPDVPDTPACQAGRYVGTFNGDYRSQLITGIPIKVAATGTLDGQPGLEFELVAREEPCGPNEEFCADFAIEGGKIRGNADWGLGALAAVPFEIDLEGELDCDTGVLRGRLENGRYNFNALIANFEVEFSGTADGTYTPFVYSFDDGVWAVTEVPPMPPPDPTPDDPSDDWLYALFALGTPTPPPEGWGGEGVWEASLVP